MTTLGHDHRALCPQEFLLRERLRYKRLVERGANPPPAATQLAEYGVLHEGGTSAGSNAG
jgi:hypothetical protein